MSECFGFSQWWNYADMGTHQGCLHQFGWRHPRWSRWGWTFPSACHRSPWSAPTADDRSANLGKYTAARDFCSCTTVISLHRRALFKRKWKVLNLGHVVVVLGEIGELLIDRELHLVVVVAVLCHGCSYYSAWDEKTEKKTSYFFAFPSQTPWTRLPSKSNLKTQSAEIEFIPFFFSGILSSILSMNVLVSRRHLLIISGSLYFFRLYTNSLPAVLSTHLSLSFSACPSVSPPVSLITVQIINRLLCLVPQLLTSQHRSTVSSIWNRMVSLFPIFASGVCIVFLYVQNLASFFQTDFVL